MQSSDRACDAAAAHVGGECMQLAKRNVFEFLVMLNDDVAAYVLPDGFGQSGFLNDWRYGLRSHTGRPASRSRCRNGGYKIRHASY
jgi:hypothetical protein